MTPTFADGPLQKQRALSYAEPKSTQPKRKGRRAAGACRVFSSFPILNIELTP